MKKEIEDAINEKFAGAANGGRIMLSFNKNKESATDIVEFEVKDFGERYKALPMSNMPSLSNSTTGRRFSLFRD